jgi:hypothetical protein
MGFGLQIAGCKFTERKDGFDKFENAALPMFARNYRKDACSTII